MNHPHPPSPKAAWIASLLLGLLAASAGATTFVKVADPLLADQAEVIVEVRVLEVDPSPRIGRPVTDVHAAVERQLAGDAVASPMVVRLPGGLIPDRGLEHLIDGVPRFRVGERALLFLSRRADGTYAVLHLMQGAFHVSTHGGRDYAWRNFSEANEVRHPGIETPRAELPRDLERFGAWLADRVSGVEREADYFAAGGLLEKFTLTRDPSSGQPRRWRQFDSGGSVTFHAHSSGQPGLPGGGFSEFQIALRAWNNDPDTPIRYLYGGTTSASAGFQDCDGVNAILFDNPNLENPPFERAYSCGGGGTIAAAGGCVFVGVTHQFNGTTFRQTAEGDIITNKNIACWLASNRRAEQVFAHELGHTLGLGHSCGDSNSPSCNSSAVLDDALMRAQAHNDNRGARLNSDDRAAIRFVYGRPAQVPEAPSDLTATAVSANRVDLTWSDNSGEETSYEVERRIGGGSFQRIAVRAADATSYQDTSALSGTTHTYRVRAVSSAGASGYSNTATATTPGEAAPTGLTATAISASQVRLDWSDNSASETGFEIEARTSGSFSLLQTAPAGATTATVGGLNAATTYTFRVRAVGGAGTSSYSNQASATTFFGEPEPCVPGPSTLCLNDGRFKVEVAWRDFVGATGAATDVGLPSLDSGLVWFFTDNNWEMLIKVLDGCGINERFWVFAAATTDVEYTMTVTDSWTGFFKTYVNGLGVASPAITDTDAFDTCSVAPPDSRRAPPAAPATAAPRPAAIAASREKQGDCEPSETRLCLNDDRFAVEIVWRDFVDATGPGKVDLFQSEDSGLMYFFDEQNLEVLVKVLDGCGINDRVWVFAAATTDVEYTMTVTDTETGEPKEYFNPLGNAAASITDTDAFDSCP